MSALSWVAVRKGPTYCSPACGRGCTFAEYGRALTRGAKLATRLGRGWRVEVWENLGWHFKVVSPCGRLSVHGRHGYYNAYLGEPDSAIIRFAGQSTTPEAAIAMTLREGHEALDYLQRLLVGLEAP